MVIMKKINRRNFLKVMGLASASLTLAACGEHCRKHCYQRRGKRCSR